MLHLKRKKKGHSCILNLNADCGTNADYLGALSRSGAVVCARPPTQSGAPESAAAAALAQTDTAAAMADEKPKEGVKTENNEHINLKVAGQDGSVVQFKIKRHTPLSKLMKAYCERQGLSMRQIRFRFDGQPINETDTPSQLEMEDEDTIDVFQQQTGGSIL
uniref:Ubiquitin-like domain-containing protein n=2 Tax=Scophthalmus maximus TaxID=52904 RepID=A0A8D3AXG7_SCOMX